MAHPCRRVLVVEDDTDLRDAIREYLEAEGIEAVEAGTGDAALEALAAEPPPDVVLLDLNIPGLAGMQLLERIRAEPRWARIPVAVMTGFSRSQFRYAPADEFLEKPFDLAQLNAALSSLCRKAQARTGSE